MGKKVKKSIIYAALILISILCLGPFLIMLVNATRDSRDIMSGFTLIPGSSFGENWKSMSGYFNIFRGLGNSLFIGVCSTILTGYFSALTAYGFTIYDFKGKNFIFTIILVLISNTGTPI